MPIAKKRQILGKHDKISEEIILSKKNATEIPTLSRHYGNFHFLNSISKEIGLTKVLKATFPKEYLEILTCAFYEISESKPLYLCQGWCEKNYVLTDKSLASQRISELLISMTDKSLNRSGFIRLLHTK